MDTIFAEATPPGRGGIAIVRISGPDARRLSESLVGPLHSPRRAELRAVRDGDEQIDEALVLWFAEGASFTGDDLVELHLHGAPVVVRRVLAALAARGLRQAEAGEFTRRAFLNGRIDLAAAEGLADLLEAETEAQRRQAMRAAAGAIGRRAEEWRATLIEAGALVEVTIDFADEEVPDAVPETVYAQLEALRDDLDRELAGYPAAERLRAGFEVAVIGPPNAGKSSLVNHIARRDVAIVSDLPGTTRDVIEVRLDLRGLAVTLLDTAGLRDSDDRIEAIGVDRARARAAAADLRVHLADDGSADPTLFRAGDIVCCGKADLADLAGQGGVSGITGEGVSALLNTIHTRLSDRVAGAGLVSHERQARALADARDALAGLRDLPPEILAEAIRRAAVSLDRLVGRIGAEDYLDVIFASFCIGK